MDMGAHAVHLLRSFIGTVDSVTATIGNASGIYSAVDDHGIALFRFANGVLGTVEASWVQTGGIGGLEVTGSEGTLFNHPQLGYVVAAPGKDAQPVEEAPALPTRVERLLAAVRGEISREELNEDLQCSADAVAIIDACYASSSSGSWVNVEKLG